MATSLSPAARRARVARWSRVLASAMFGLAVAIPLAVVAALAVLPGADFFAGVGLPPPEPGILISPATRAGAGAALAAAPLVLAYGIFRLRTAFREFAAGRLFSGEAFRSLRDFATALAFSAIIGVAGRAAASAVLSLNATGRGTLAIKLGSPEIVGVALAGLFWILGWILAEAAELEAENRQFV